MSPSAFDRAARTFLEARLLAGAERQEFLRRACAGDAALREEVDRLLVGDSAPAPFVALGEQLRPAVEELFASPPEALAGIPDRIGRYRVVGVIGEGGMGIVYEAEQDSPRRRVAVKVLRRQYGSARLIGRFRREAEILGRLQHPGIAQILEAGTTVTCGSEQPFIAMEYVHGRPLLEYVRERNPGRRERLALIATVCDAVHYAHQSGVVHRDLKPGNILVLRTDAPGTRSQGVSGATPTGSLAVKVLDFGVARLTDADMQAVTLHTTVGELIGTVPYMSPEQAAGDPAGLDWRSDVYTLGVILYELLTGRLPQDVRTLLVHEAVRAIREDDPTPAGSVDRSLRGDIETIIAKALEKDKTRRYQSAAELAADIRRHLSEQPIAARPASAVYRMRKFARRNKAIVAGICVAFASMLLVTMMAVRQAVVNERARAREQGLRRVADARTAEAEWQAYRASLVAASGALRHHEVSEARRHLQAAPERLRGWEWRHLSSRLDDSLASINTGFTPIQVAVSADGAVVASCSSGGSISVWSAPEVLSAARRGADAPPPMRYALEGNVQQRRVREFHFSTAPDGAVELRADTQGGSVRLSVGEPARGEPRSAARGVRTLTPLASDTQSGFWRSHNGQWGVRAETESEPEVIVVQDLASGVELLRIPRHEFIASFSTDDRLLALGLDDGLASGPGLFIYELRGVGGGDHEGASAGTDAAAGSSAPHAPGAVLRCHRPDLVDLSGIAFSRDGSRAAIAAGSSGSPISIIDTSKGLDLTVFRGQSVGGPGVVKIAFSQDDALLATASADGSVRLWRADDGALLSVMHGNRATITGLCFTVMPGRPDRSALVTSGADGTIRWWGTTLTADPFVLQTPATPYGLAFSPDGTRLAAACLGGEKPLRVWDAATGRELLAALDGYGSALAFSPDGGELAFGRSRGPSNVVDSRTGAVLATLPQVWWRIDWMGFDERGGVLSLGNGGDMFAHDVSTGERLRYGKAPSGDENHGCRAALSPDGSLLLVAARRDLHVLDAHTWESLGTLSGHTNSIYAVAFSPDGARAISGSADRTLRVWDVATRQTIATMTGHADAVFAAAFSPDGSRIASGGRDRVVRIWDAQRFEEITQLHGHTSLVFSLAFSPDGRMLASGGGDSTIRLWDTTPLRDRLLARGAEAAGGQAIGSPD